jgi:alpha-L-fucosidase
MPSKNMETPTKKEINMKHFWIGKVWLLALIFALSGLLRAAPESGQEEKVDAGNYQAVHARALAEFKAARFGMFIHWGLYSMPAREGEAWEMQVHRVPSDVYEKYMSQFNPTQWNAERIVEMAEHAGMKYIDVTTKHHDGFCMFDSKLTDYKITNSPIHRDVIRELVEACHRHGMKIILYYSLLDWHHPDYMADPDQIGSSWAVLHRHNALADWNRYVAYYQGQVKELLSNYGHIDGMMFDGGWNRKDWHVWKLDETFAMIHQLQPWVLINNHDSVKRTPPDEDYQSPEQRFESESNLLVEVCATLNDSWGYNDSDTHFKSAEQLIHLIADTAGRGGNSNVDIGPMANGDVQSDFVERLDSVGHWMRINADSIYGTEKGPFQDETSGTYFGTTTRKGNRIFLHVLNWPYKVLEVNGVITPVKSAYFLQGHTGLEFHQESGHLTIDLPLGPLDPCDTVIVLETAGP